MAKVRTCFSIEPSTDRQLTRTARRFGFSRSHLVQEVLSQALPTLDKKDRFLVWAEGLKFDQK